MLTVALKNPTIKCNLHEDGKDLRTARRAIALIAGPPHVLAELGLNTDDGLREVEDMLENRVIDPAYLGKGGFARGFAAQFPGMTDVRMTVLACAPRFPDLEDSLRQAWQGADRTWEPPKDGETLADSLRKLPEPQVRELALTAMKGA